MIICPHCGTYADACWATMNPEKGFCIACKGELNPKIHNDRKEKKEREE